MKTWGAKEAALKARTNSLLVSKLPSRVHFPSLNKTQRTEVEHFKQASSVVGDRSTTLHTSGGDLLALCLTYDTPMNSTPVTSARGLSFVISYPVANIAAFYLVFSCSHCVFA